MSLAMMTLASIVSLAPVQLAPRTAAGPKGDEPGRSSRPAESSTFGLMLDAGAPDGACLSLVVRPWSMLRAHAGGGYNMVGPGVRGGLTLIPFDTFLRPTLSIEAGRYFAGDLSTVDELVPIGDVRQLRIAYDWASAHAGLELDWGGGAFFIEGGVTRVWARLDMPDLVEGVRARVFAPTAKLGFIVWID
jgi:hypothetical protein